MAGYLVRETARLQEENARLRALLRYLDRAKVAGACGTYVLPCGVFDECVRAASTGGRATVAGYAERGQG